MNHSQAEPVPLLLLLLLVLRLVLRLELLPSTGQRLLGQLVQAPSRKLPGPAG